MATQTSLQKMLEDRADKKLENRLRDFRKILHNDFADIFEAMSKDTLIIMPDDKRQNLHGALFNVSSHLFVKAKEVLLPRYIETETTHLLNAVDNLQREINDLKLGIEYED